MSITISPIGAASLAIMALLLAGCGTADQLSKVGKRPALSAIEDPTAQPGYKPVTLPQPAKEPAVYTANSLWRSNDQSFFRDSRARKVGDILTVNITINDEAEFENSTAKNRTMNRTLGVGTGLLGTIFSAIPGVDNANAILSANANSTTDGNGTTERSEELNTTMAAVIVQKMPNGNLVIEGKQEVRVNYEIRELIVAGIIRPEDIKPDNTIESSKIAQARISYGGRGKVTNATKTPIGTQILDIVSPF